MAKRTNKSYFNNILGVKILYTEPLVKAELKFNKFSNTNIVNSDSNVITSNKNNELNNNTKHNNNNTKHNINIIENNVNIDKNSIITNEDISDVTNNIGGYEVINRYEQIIKNKDIRLRFFNYLYSVCKNGINITRTILLHKNINVEMLKKYAEFEFNNMEIDREAEKILNIEENCNLLHFPFQSHDKSYISITAKKISKEVQKGKCVIIKENDAESDKSGFLIFWKNFYESLSGKKIYYSNKKSIDNEMTRNKFKLISSHYMGYNITDNPGNILYTKYIKL